MIKNIDLLSHKGKSPTQILKDLGLFSAPVKLKPLCAALGVHAIPEYFDTSDLGIIGVSVEGDIEFLVDTLCGPLNRRILMAHQLGHLIHDIIPKIESGGAAEFTETGDTLRKNGRQLPAEYRANFFSANLLMPKALVMGQGNQLIAEMKRASGEDKVSGEDFISKMAGVFQVPQKAMTDQLICLGVIPFLKNIEVEEPDDSCGIRP